MARDWFPLSFQLHVFSWNVHIKQEDIEQIAQPLLDFLMRYWTPQGSKLARLVEVDCQLCKLHYAKFLEQPMGILPEARLKPAPAFNNVMLDLFVLFRVRGEVQKCTSGKAYGVLFTNLAMRAVHIEAVFGYDTSN